MLADARKTTATAFLPRALRRFHGHGTRAERGTTDNGSAHRSRRFARALRLLRVRHSFTRPCTPRTGGMVACFIQALLREPA
jgi:transposase InsO family protein